MAYPTHARADRMTKFEYAACVAASIAYLLMDQQDAAGLVLFDHAIRELIPPTRHTSRIRQLIDVIDRATPDRDSNVARPRAELVEQVRHRGMVVLISDLLVPLDDVRAALQRCRHAGHEAIVLHVLDRDEIDFPFTDNVLFEGLEAADVQVLTDPQSLRRSYRTAMQAYLSQLRSACLDTGVDYALIATTDSLGVALSSFLARRMRRTRR
jgi:uncharacterized protein (DUF58 family)